MTKGPAELRTESADGWQLGAMATLEAARQQDDGSGATAHAPLLCVQTVFSALAFPSAAASHCSLPVMRVMRCRLTAMSRLNSHAKESA